MPLEIRYGTQGACPDLPSALRTIAVRARQAGAGGVRLGSRLRAVGLFAHIHCPRSLEHQKRWLPVVGNRRESASKRASALGHRSRPTARPGRETTPSVGAVWLEQRPLEPRIAKGT